MTLVAMWSGVAVELHLPVGRRLTDTELAAWRARTPLTLRLSYRVLDRPITATLVNPWTSERMPPGSVWLWWGGPDGRPTFGPLDTTWMYIPYGSD